MDKQKVGEIRVAAGVTIDGKYRRQRKEDDLAILKQASILQAMVSAMGEFEISPEVGLQDGGVTFTVLERTSNSGIKFDEDDFYEFSGIVADGFKQATQSAMSSMDTVKLAKDLTSKTGATAEAIRKVVSACVQSGSSVSFLDGRGRRLGGVRPPSNRSQDIAVGTTIRRVLAETSDGLVLTDNLDIKEGDSVAIGSGSPADSRRYTVATSAKITSQEKLI